MENYPRQFISELVNNIDPKLVTFLNTMGDYYKFSSSKLIDLVELVLRDNLNDRTTKDYMQSILTEQNKQRKRKMARWASKIQKNDKFIKEYLLNQYKILNITQFQQLYNCVSIEDAQEVILSKLDEWKCNSNSYLTDFLFLNTLTHRKIYDAFQSDLFVNIVDIIFQKHDGSIDSYLNRKPESLINLPFFAPKNYTYGIPQSKLISIDTDSDFEVTVSVPENSQDKKVKLLDNIDAKILGSIILMIRHTKDFYDKRTVEVDIGSIAREIYTNGNPSKQHYELVKQRIHKMGHLSYSFQSKVDENIADITFSLFDTVISFQNKVTVTLGTILYDNIIKKKLISVTSSSYNALENPLSQILYHSLQRERIVLTNNNIESKVLYNEYDYNFFTTNILFVTKKKKEIERLIIETLDEFVNKKIAIEDYKIIKNKYFIHFYPLTSDEKIDLLKDYNIDINS